MRRFGAILAAAALVAACASPGSSPPAGTASSTSSSAVATSSSAALPSGGGAPVSITLLTHWPPDQVAKMQTAVDKFHAANPNITVNVRAVPFGDLLSTLRTQATSPSGPTVVSIYDLWLPELVQEGVAAKAPDAVVTDVNANWPANIVAGQTIGGAIYGYPNEIDTYQLLYNTKLFADAGISGPPATWADLIADAQKLTKRDTSGNITQQGFELINSWTAGVLHPWLSMVEADGGQLLNGTTPQLDSKAALETTQLYDDLVHKYKVTNPAFGTSNASTAGPFIDNFANGKSAMMILSNPFQSAIQTAMGAAFSNVGVAPIPTGPSGSGAKNVSYSWLTVVNARASQPQQQAAWQFLTWLDDPGSGTSGSGMADLLLALGILPSRTSDQQAFSSQLSGPFLKPYVDGLTTAVPFPDVLGGEQLSEAIQKQIEAVEFGNATPQAAMQSAQSQAKQILSQFYP